MSNNFFYRIFFIALLIIGASLVEAKDRTFRFRNNCKQNIWVGSLNNPGHHLPSDGGWTLKPGATASVTTPGNWAGRFWGRTGCTFDQSGKGVCSSGDCGGKLACTGAGGAPPVSLMEFTLSGASGLDFYDISLVDGYNLPVKIAPFDGTGSGCDVISCIKDLNKICPAELQVKDKSGKVVGCKSACERFGTDALCCRGEHDTPATCPPSSYSRLFKSACPTSYSYAYDDPSSTFTCRDASYEMTFCPQGV